MITQRDVFRWVARVGSIFSIGLVLLFAFGERELGPSPTMKEWVGLSFWPIGVSLGMVLGWFRERAGGLLTTACLIAFYVWHYLGEGDLPQGPWFFFFSAPGILFLYAGRPRSRGPELDSAPTPPRAADVLSREALRNTLVGDAALRSRRPIVGEAPSLEDQRARIDEDAGRGGIEGAGRD